MITASYLSGQQIQGRDMTLNASTLQVNNVYARGTLTVNADRLTVNDTDRLSSMGNFNLRVENGFTNRGVLSSFGPQFTVNSQGTVLNYGTFFGDKT